MTEFDSPRSFPKNPGDYQALHSHCDQLLVTKCNPSNALAFTGKHPLTSGNWKYNILTNAEKYLSSRDTGYSIGVIITPNHKSLQASDPKRAFSNNCFDPEVIDEDIGMIAMARVENTQGWIGDMYTNVRLNPHWSGKGYFILDNQKYENKLPEPDDIVKEGYDQPDLPKSESLWGCNLNYDDQLFRVSGKYNNDGKVCSISGMRRFSKYSMGLEAIYVSELGPLQGFCISGGLRAPAPVSMIYPALKQLYGRKKSSTNSLPQTIGVPIISASLTTFLRFKAAMSIASLPCPEIIPGTISLASSGTWDFPSGYPSPAIGIAHKTNDRMISFGMEINENSWNLGCRFSFKALDIKNVNLSFHLSNTWQSTHYRHSYASLEDKKYNWGMTLQLGN